MYVRVTLVAVIAAVLPFAGATAHASCLDDATSGISTNFANDPKSEYWDSGYVQHSGTATVTIHGDALVSDYTIYSAEVVRYAGILSAGAPDRATTFVDCVAG